MIDGGTILEVTRKLIGETEPYGDITEWAIITGLNRSTLNNRYYRGDRGERLFEGVRYKWHA